MITHFDELPHGIRADEFWRESWYLNFFDHSQELYGIAWLGVRPNVQHGEVLFAIGKGNRFLHMYEEFDIPIAADIGRERSGFGPLRFQVVEPYKRWSVSFSDGAATAELQWEAATPVYNWEWQDSARSWHYQHPGRVWGTIAVGDERFQFDGLGERDRGWGRRDNSYFTANHWITAQFPSGLTFEGMALPVEGENQLYGFAQRDGDSSLLREMRVSPRYAFPGGPPVAATIEAHDQSGRSFELRQELMNVITMIQSAGGQESRQYFTFNRYECDGERGYGMMDHWWSDFAVLDDSYLCREPNRGRLGAVGDPPAA
ncbi:MAG TPA: hypothetical protein VFQ14_04425 [Thermoleophilaceae bacterium]|nr:hypothetical protein [Thermoleophilaceae bacterium]